jgi:exopolysaccharide biosynthesis polyprenyl glycosylphosphotransferase
LLAVACWSGSLALASAYDPQRVLRWYDEAVRVALGGIMATVWFAGALYILFREMSRFQFAYFFAVNLAFVLAHRATLRILYRLRGRNRPGWRRRVLILGAGDLGRRVARVVLDHSRWGFDLAGFLDDDPAKHGQTHEGASVLGAIDLLREVVHAKSIDEVWCTLPVRAHQRLEWVVAEAETLPVRIKIVPDYFSLALVRAQAELLAGVPLIGLREPVIEGPARLAKRLFDLVVTALAVIAAAPFMAVVAVLIRLDSPGPVLFRQERAGENGRLFRMLKFRTMFVDAEARRAEVVRTIDTGELVHKRRDDPRVTRVGRWLRRFSLDELPQLFNVLRGEMSLVGPRPEQPWLVEKYQPWQRRRFAVPQGITGWWQISGRSDRPMHLNTDADLYYVYNYSLWLDILILARTPQAVLSGKGAF